MIIDLLKVLEANGLKAGAKIQFTNTKEIYTIARYKNDYLYLESQNGFNNLFITNLFANDFVVMDPQEARQ